MSDGLFARLGRGIDAFLEIPKLLQSIKEDIKLMDQNTQNAFADLRTEVEAVKSNEAAAATLLQGLHDQLDTALNQPGASSDDIVAAITEITGQLKQDTDTLAAAVAANSGNSSSGSGSSGGTGSTGSTGTGSSDTGSTGTGSTDTTGSGSGSTDTTTSGDAGVGTNAGDATDPTA